MHRARLLALVLAMFVLPLGLVACGDDDDSSSDQAEDQITKAIEVSATSQDPSVCTDLQTQNFTEQTSGSTGQEAIKDCRKSQQEEPIATSVEVREIEVDDGNATAVVDFNDGFIAGQSLEVGMVEENGQWKLDSLVDFVDFDRGQYIDTLVRGISEEEGVNQQTLDCVRGELEDVSDEQLQATFLENDETVFDETLGPCFKNQQG